MTIGSSLAIAFRALSRNKLQTALTTIGMTIGVATVLTMIALGTGAQTAIEQQVAEYGSRIVSFKDGHIVSDVRNVSQRVAKSELATMPAEAKEAL